MNNDVNEFRIFQNIAGDKRNENVKNNESKMQKEKEFSWVTSKKTLYYSPSPHRYLGTS